MCGTPVGKYTLVLLYFGEMGLAAVIVIQADSSRSFPVDVSVACLHLGVMWPLSIYVALYDPQRN